MVVDGHTYRSNYRPQQSLSGSPQLCAVVATREQMAVAIRGHRDRGMAESGLHEPEGQFESAVDATIDAPAGIEMAERVVGQA